MAKKKNRLPMSDEEWKRLNDEFDASLTPSKQIEPPDPRFTERHEGKTPLGGDYSIAYFYDADHNPCVKAEAKYANIVIYDKSGRRVNEVYGDLR